jgi:phosphoribosyl 1,2-cyclic phosphodiesterase
MKLHYLSSGSKGNLTLIQHRELNILVDFGVSNKRAKDLLATRNVSLEDITHIFITHEHSDHVSGLEVFYKKNNPKLCVTKKTFKKINERVKFKEEPVFIKKNEVNEFDGFKCHVLEMSHDAVDPVGFIFLFDDLSYGHVTDTGYLHMKYYEDLKNLDAYFMESNHDVKMLMESRYPWHLRKRIISDLGHMSNIDCAYHLNNLVGDKTKCVVLGHLSDENTTKDIAYNSLIETFGSHQTPYEHLLIKTIDQTEILDEIDIT